MEGGGEEPPSESSIFTRKTNHPNIFTQLQIAAPLRCVRGYDMMTRVYVHTIQYVRCDHYANNKKNEGQLNIQEPRPSVLSERES